jgi:hypothetical protein
VFSFFSFSFGGGNSCMWGWLFFSHSLFLLVFRVDVCLGWCLFQLWIVGVWSMLRGNDNMLVGAK